MSQISPPVRIVAVVAVAFLAVYMLVLRPKSSSAPAPAPAPATTPAGNIHTGKPAVTQFGKAVQAAQGAAKATEKQMQTEAHNAGAPAASSTPSATTHSATAAKPQASRFPSVPAASLKGLPRPVVRAVHRHKVLALLFWDRHSADDRAVRRKLRHVQHFDGTVYTHAAPVGQVARYGLITRGVDVSQTPTVVVVDRKLHATTLVGYVDLDTIDQAVVDALRATGGIFNSRYLARINGVCSQSERALWSVPRPQNLTQARHDVHRLSSRADRFVSDFAAVPAPRKWRSLRRASLADLRVVQGSNHRLARMLEGHPSLRQVVTTLVAEDRTITPAAKRFGHRMDRHGVIFCGSNG